MNIVVKYTAQLKKEAGIASQNFEVVEEDNLQSLLLKVSQSYNENFHDMLFTTDEIFRQSIMIVHNGAQVGIADSLLFAEGDEILLMSPIAGG